MPSPGPATTIREAARRYVADGEPLDAFLDDLEFAYYLLDLAPPSPEVVREASLAWADEILGILDRVACHNPLTGLSTLEHARRHLQVLGQGLTEHAVVVVSLLGAASSGGRRDLLEAAFEESLRLAVVGETVRSIFEQCDLLVSLPHGRVLAVVRAGSSLEEQADTLARQLRRSLPISSAPRVRVTAMPPTEALVLELLEELAGAGYS